MSQMIHKFFIRSSDIIIHLRNDEGSRDVSKIDYAHDESNRDACGYSNRLDDNDNTAQSFDRNKYIPTAPDLSPNSKPTREETENRNIATDMQTNKRNSENPERTLKPDVWFNLKTFSNAPTPRSVYLPWENKDITLLPPMIVETVLDLTGLTDYEQISIDANILNTKKKTEIVLERWLIKLDLDKYDNDTIDLQHIYMEITVLFRCLYTLVGLLPTSDLVASELSSRITTKISDGSKALTSKGRYGLSRPLIPDKPEIDIVQSKNLSPIMTPIGALELSVSYRQNCNFNISENKNLSNKINQSSPKDIIKYTDTGSKHNNNVEHHTIVSPNIGNIKFRTSSTSINSQTSKRRPSGRSVSIFKTGSIASSSSPPPQQPHSFQANSQSHTISYPIPVKRNDSASSVHFFNNSGDKHEINMNSNNALVASISSKFASSVGSKFKNHSLSRNNSVERQLMVGNNFTPSSNPVLQNLKAKNKHFTSSYSDMDPNNSLYLDDDLNSFMKLLDSKPDLRVSNNSPTVYDDSLSNFRSLKKNNDLFIDSPLKSSFIYSRSTSPSSPPKPPPLIDEQTTLDSTVKLLLDNKQQLRNNNQNQTYMTSAPITCSNSNTGLVQNTGLICSSVSSANNQISNNFGYQDRTDAVFSRIRTSSKCSRDSRESRGSRGSRGSKESHNSRGSVGFIHGPLVASSTSYSPTFASNTANPLTGQSVHSVLKASAISGTTGAVATGISSSLINSNCNADLEKSQLKPLFSNGVSNKNMERGISIPETSSSPRNTTNVPASIEMAKCGSGGKAHSLLRSLSISASTTAGPGIFSRSRTGSGASVTSNNLRAILQNSLKNESFSRNMESRSSITKRNGHITPDQLKDMSYGQHVFESDDDEEDGEEDVDYKPRHQIVGEEDKNVRDRKTSADRIKVGNASGTKMSDKNPKGLSEHKNNDYDSKADKIKSQPSRDKKPRSSLGNVLNNMKHMQRRQSNQFGIAGSFAGPVTLPPGIDRFGEQYNDCNTFGDDDDDDDDLLFEMSDMTSNK